jgi:hypothetical protein
MFFGQYLLSKGAISREALIETIELQREKNLSLVELAVRDGCLEPRRAETILTAYRTTDAELEDLCEEIGRLDREKIDQLLEKQRADRVMIGAALIESGHLSADHLEEHLSAFHEVQRAAEKRLEADFRACSHPAIVKTVVELAVFHLKRFTEGPVKLLSLSEDGGELEQEHRRYVQKLKGDHEIHVVLDLPPEIETLIGRGLLGIPVEEGSEVAIDAVCECVNIVGGHVCTELESDAIKLRPEPPFASDTVTLPGGERASVRAALLAGDSEADIRVFV